MPPRYSTAAASQATPAITSPCVHAAWLICRVRSASSAPRAGRRFFSWKWRMRLSASMPAPKSSRKSSTFMALPGPLSLDRLHPVFPGDQQHIRRPLGEEAHADHPGDGADLGLQLRGIHDAQVMHVQDVVAVVGGEAL